MQSNQFEAGSSVCSHHGFPVTVMLVQAVVPMFHYLHEVTAAWQLALPCFQINCILQPYSSAEHSSRCLFALVKGGTFSSTSVWQVRSVPVTTRQIELSELAVKDVRKVSLRPTFEASLRLDAIASAGFSTSRSKVVSMIKAGDIRFVLAGYSLCACHIYAASQKNVATSQSQACFTHSLHCSQEKSEGDRQTHS